jgi:hypothetical protein
MSASNTALRLRRLRLAGLLGVSTQAAAAGGTGSNCPVQRDACGDHHRGTGRFLARKPARYAAGHGKVHLRRLRCRALQ